LILANLSTLAYPKDTATAIANIGKTNIRLYINKYNNHRECNSLLCALKNQSIVKYGPDEHGNKNKLTNIHTKNAHIGDEIFSIISIILGLREKGTSITNRFPYQK